MNRYRLCYKVVGTITNTFEVVAENKLSAITIGNKIAPRKNAGLKWAIWIGKVE